MWQRVPSSKEQSHVIDGLLEGSSNVESLWLRATPLHGSPLVFQLSVAWISHCWNSAFNALTSHQPEKKPLNCCNSQKKKKKFASKRLIYLCINRSCHVCKSFDTVKVRYQIGKQNQTRHCESKCTTLKDLIKYKDQISHYSFCI